MYFGVSYEPIKSILFISLVDRMSENEKLPKSGVSNFLKIDPICSKKSLCDFTKILRNFCLYDFSLNLLAFEIQRHLFFGVRLIKIHTVHTSCFERFSLCKTIGFPTLHARLLNATSLTQNDDPTKNRLELQLIPSINSNQATTDIKLVSSKSTRFVQRSLIGIN